MSKMHFITEFPFGACNEKLKGCTPQNINILGQTGVLADKISKNWLTDIRQTNPSILTMFRDRDTLPYRDLLPWSGEFAGKHITGAYYIYMLTRDEQLYNEITEFIDELISYQADDGYLGVFAKNCRLTGAYSHNPSETGCTWDAWSHYHIMYGLYLWYSLTKKEAYKKALLKCADLFMNTFYEGRHSLASIGSTEMNLAPFHIFALLYRMTCEEKYIKFAKNIEFDIGTEKAGNYIETALQGIEFYMCPKPRWESLHVILGIAEMYLSTGEEYYLTSARQIINSILKTDIHNTGAFSTEEQAIGHPYKNDTVETCCVVAFNALAIRMLNITGDLSLLDYLERSHYNAVMGSFSPTGKWSTYNTPMDGVKHANFHDINFQCRAGSPQLNCCSVNAPRGVGEVSAWMFTKRDDALCVNFYESFEAEFEDIHISCQSDYPAPGDIILNITGEGKKLALRIPSWSKASSVEVNGVSHAAEQGTYFELEINAKETEIVLHLDFSVYLEAGDMDYKGKYSVFSGPILYGASVGDNSKYDITQLPAIDKVQLSHLPERQADGSVLLNTGDIVLRDFYSLGTDGSYYRTWLSVE